MDNKRFDTLIFSSTNSRNNKINVFGSNKGILEYINSYETRGRGTNENKVDPLHSQGSICISIDRQTLYVVNAGSDEITVFAIGKNNTLRYLQKISSGGKRPISIAISSKNLYVLNSGDSDTLGNITNFRILRDGTLRNIDRGSKTIGKKGQLLGGLIINRMFTKLIVSETGSNLISIHSLDNRGNIIQQVENKISGKNPYGIVQNESNTYLVVNEESESITSFKVNNIGTINPIDNSKYENADGMTKIVITKDREFAYVINDRGISQFIIYEDNEINFMNFYDTGNKFSKISEITIDNKGKYLYTIDEGNGSINSYLIQKHGILKNIQMFENMNMKKIGNIGLISTGLL